jgi:hypothetical protein
MPVGDPTRNEDKVLSPTAVGEGRRTQILRDEEIPTRGELSGAAAEERALGRGSGLSSLPPFDPEERIVWAVNKALAETFTGERRQELLDAFKAIDEDKAEFLKGAVAGFGKAVKELVEDYLSFIKEGVGGVIRFFSLATDPEIWVQMLAIWSGPVGSMKEFEEFGPYLRAEYPGLWAAMGSYPRLGAALRRFLTGLEDGRALANLCVTLVEGLAELFRDKLDEFIRLKGEPYDQGVLVAETLGVAVVQAILLLLQLQALARSLLRAGRKLLLNLNVAGKVEALLKGAEELRAAARAVKEVEKEAQRLYQQLADEIASYNKLNRLTGDFNRCVRATLVKEGTALGPEVEYIGLRLDADHILEGRTFSWFEKEFKALGWASSKEMDALAVHTEFHIRSGSGLTDAFNIADDTFVGESSLTKLKMDFIGKDPKKYPNVLSFVEKYEEFYQTQAPQYYPKVSAWFTDLKAKIRAKGL